ncbi:MAG: DUF2628 domain-containing protein [Rhabdaerophilum sp.]
MARYVVHVKGEGPEALAGARFVRDGFSWRAFAFGAFWLLAKGAWISALIVLALQAVFLLLATALGLPEWLPMTGFSLINLFLALESGALQSWELALKGFREVAVVAGDDPDTLEQRFFSEKLAEPAPAPLVAASTQRISSPVPVIGLFPSHPRGGVT